MFSAKYFIYDGRMSANYGLQIVDFDDNVVKEIDTYSPTLSLQKVPGLLRFFHGGVEYDSAPTCEFSILSETEIPIELMGEILSWLVGRKQFKNIQFIGGDSDDYVFRCVFTSVKTIRINGHCHGFRLTAQFESPFAIGASETEDINTGSSTISIRNKSDIIDGYVYPTISFKVNGTCNSDAQAINWAMSQKSLETQNDDGTTTPLSNYNICIINMTDDENRRFIFAGLEAGEEITVDNEVRYISSSINGEKLSNFNKNWLRLRKGYNQLQIEINGTGTITCPYYAMVGF